MKKIIAYIKIILLISFLCIFSCQKDDEFTDKEAERLREEMTEYTDSIKLLTDSLSTSHQLSIDSLNFVRDSIIRDSLEEVFGAIDYHLTIIDNSSITNLKSTSSLKNATRIANAIVTVSQYGITLTDTTDDNGMVIFSDLRFGKLSGVVKLSNYTDVDFIANIKSEGTAVTFLPVFSTTENLSTISGKVTLETDLTNKSREVIEGIEVLANIDSKDNEFKKYLQGLYSDPNNVTGDIIQIVYYDTQFSDKTDNNGNYSLQVPATPEGLPIKLRISEFATEQTLLLNELKGDRVTGPQTIRTYFHDSINPSFIPNVPGAFVEFSSPKGAVNEAPDIEASAKAHIGESGILNIEVNNQGFGYTQPPRLEIEAPDNPVGIQATAEANISNGKVNSVKIIESGSGYTSTPNIDVKTIDDGDFGEKATAIANLSYELIEVNITSGGTGYKKQPEVFIYSNTGKNATAQAIMTGYVEKVEVISPGIGYICPPEIRASIPDEGNDVATFNVNMTTNNPIHSIELTENFDSIYEKVPEIIIDASGVEGSGATAIAKLKNKGGIKDISINNPGAGYIQPPTINISGGGGFGASAYATIDENSGSISAIIVTEEGKGYSSEPSIEISAPPSGGTQAFAEAVLAYEIDKIVITNPGNGYNILYNTPTNYSSQPTVIIDEVPLLPNNQVIVRPSMGIKSIGINNQGSGYSSPPNISINAKCGKGSGGEAVASLLYEVNKIEVLTPGSGFAWNDINVTIAPPVDPSGNAAKATGMLGNGVISEIEISKQGDGYTAPPLVKVSGGNPERKAVFSTNVSNGSVNEITIVDAGEGYAFAPTLDIRTYKTGASFIGTVFEEAGLIERIELKNPGAGYKVVPDVEIVNDGTGGTGAEATAQIKDGKVINIEIVNPGGGYVNPPVINLVIPNYIETAVGLVQTNDKGRITDVIFNSPGLKFLTKGMGYIDQPDITFTPHVEGMGEGAIAKAVIKNGQIDNVIMINQGNGYKAKNYPVDAMGFDVSPNDNGINGNLNVIANKKYIRDIYLGTGERQTP